MEHFDRREAKPDFDASSYQKLFHVCGRESFGFASLASTARLPSYIKRKLSKVAFQFQSMYGCIRKYRKLERRQQTFFQAAFAPFHASL